MAVEWKGLRAVRITRDVTAIERSKYQVLLYIPSDQTDSGDHIAATEIYINKTDIKLLSDLFPPED